MIIFLFFSFLFLPSNPEMQGFASYGIIENNVQMGNGGSNSSQEPDPPNNDDSTGKDGIDEDWMFGKTKTIHYLV